MAKNQSKDISIVEIKRGQATFCVLGTSPIILNRLSQKTKMELLLPKGRKTAADKLGVLKHEPLQEYRASAYTLLDKKSPTYLAHLSSAFKGALRGAALDQPGSTKSQIGRLTYVEGDYVGIYGAPKLFMSITRSAGMNRTPDVRTRLIIPEWAAYVTITWVKPLINETAVTNLLVAAGISQGVGDWRPEKGAGSYGQFMPVNKNDKDFKRIIKNGGRKVQLEGLENPECYDNETADLLSWYDTEVVRRGFKVVS